MMMNACRSITLLAALALAGTVSADGVEPGQWSLGVYGGWYQPEPSLVDDDFTYGLRLGYMIDEHWAVSGSLGFMNLSGDELEIDERLDADIDLTFLDFDVFYAFNPQSRFVFTVGGGFGWSFVDGDIKAYDDEGVFLGSASAQDDGLTFNLALGPVIKLTDNMVLRLMTRFRYFDERDDDEIDREFTAALVWGLGG
jgi:opacity protein-like surface antigen